MTIFRELELLLFGIWFSESSLKPSLTSSVRAENYLVYPEWPVPSTVFNMQLLNG